MLAIILVCLMVTADIGQTHPCPHGPYKYSIHYYKNDEITEDVVGSYKGLFKKVIV